LRGLAAVPSRRSSDLPFRPHALARLRFSAYQRWVLMRYLDNLIEWGDHLFRQDTIESNNEALQLYVLAAQLLGPRPTALPAQEADRKSTRLNSSHVKI